MKVLHQDPDATVCLGRQPEFRKLTPSNPFPWYGSWAEGHRYSLAQEAELMRRGADPVTTPGIVVKRQAKREEYVFPTRELAPRYEMECPVIGKARDGRIRVIAPSGEAKLVQPDGWSHRPFRLPDCYRLGYAMMGAA